MRHSLSEHALRVLAGMSLVLFFSCALTRAQEGRPIGTAAGKPPYNILFVINDQHAYRLFGRV